MYCGKCGVEVSKNATFCPKCGNHIGTIQVNNEIKNDHKRVRIPKMVITISMVVIAIVVIVIIAVMNNNGYEKPIKNFYKAIENHDSELLESSLSDYLIENMLSDYSDAGYSGNVYASIIEEFIDDLDCGENVEIDYRITEVIDAEENDYLELRNNYSFWYEYINDDSDEYKVKNPMVIKTSADIKGVKSSETFTSEFLIIKENGKWKILIEDDGKGY